MLVVRFLGFFEKLAVFQLAVPVVLLASKEEANNRKPRFLGFFFLRCGFRNEPFFFGVILEKPKKDALTKTS